ncbi:Methionyl-tRNA formyltransferase [hydrothermal vent metagenome]|uniref:methionyl-tRNA formyltransferase n=1 Tax=hydrothermal vent metagenome TaxID=652676 RepID=A0A3B1E4F1_9ZZZZ
MSNKITLVFMGTPDFATGIFEGLLKSNFDILAIFTQPDKAVGRKKILTPPHIKQFCIKNNINIPIYQPAKLRDSENVEILKKLNPSFIVVSAYAQILSLDILKIAPCINLHASLLPQYRGASPIQQSLLNDNNQTGVTAMLMDEGLDTGDILGYVVFDIPKHMFVDDLFDKLCTLATKLAINTLNNFNKVSHKKQISALSSHTKKINKQQGLIEFDNAKYIHLKHKAFKGWPDIFLANGLKLISVEINSTKNTNDEKGSIVEICKTYVVVACDIGSLKIYVIQPPSKQKMSIVDYIKGKRIGIGDLLL